MNGQTLLSDIDIPHWDVVLDEIFAVPPPEFFPEAARPLTVGDLAKTSGLSEFEVIAKLQAVVRMSEAIEITGDELAVVLADGAQKAATLIVDVREEWEYEICHLADSLLLCRLSFPELLPRLQASPLGVVICHHGVRSYSAALYLRQQGVKTARSLEGGLQAWAEEHDQTMASY